MACEVVWRVVSLPATESSTNQAEISAWVRRSPSISACTSAVIRSSPGCFSRWAAISDAACESVQIAWPSVASGSRPSRNRSSATETIVSAASTTCSRSASGTPIMSEIVWSGSRLAISDDEVAAPGGRGLRDDLLGGQPDALLDLGHPPRRERRRHQPAQLRVAGSVHRDEGQRGLPELLAERRPPRPPRTRRSWDRVRSA